MNAASSDQERQAIFRKFEKLRSTSWSFISLGVWSGQGDWATTSQKYRDQQGQRALTDLDALIAQLAEFRDELAAAVNT